MSEFSEPHFCDVTNPGQILNNTFHSAVLLMNGIANGATFFQRSGNKIYNMVSDLEMSFQNNSGYFTDVSVYMIWDYVPSSTLPDYSTMQIILEDYNSGGAASYNPGYSRVDPGTTCRFVVLQKQQFTLENKHVNSDGSWLKDITMHTPIPGGVTQYQGQGALIADISAGALYCVISSNFDSRGTNLTVAYTHRLTYFD